MGLMGPYNSLCVLRGLYGFVLVLIFPFASLWILIGSLWVLIGPYLGLWTLKDSLEFI